MELMAFVQASVEYEDLKPTPQLRSFEEMGSVVTKSAGAGLVGLTVVASVLTTSFDALALVRSGDSGTEVREVQAALVDLGYDLGEIDGVFGPVTEDAVLQFQRSRNLITDGIVGSQTLAALGLEDGASSSTATTATTATTPSRTTVASTPTSTSTPTTASTSNTRSSSAASPGIILTTGASANVPRLATVDASGGLTVRANPGLDSTAIGTKADGARISLTGQEMRLDGYVWAKLAGEPGWVAAQYLTSAASSTSSRNTSTPSASQPATSSPSSSNGTAATNVTRTDTTSAASATSNSAVRARVEADALIVRTAPNGQDTGSALVQGETVSLTGVTVLRAGRNWSELSDGNWVASDYLVRLD
jgi:peptidoglycan hydrolase-like protein with peptidoglycan-binding domain